MHAIRLFSDVARCRSFSQAASLHGISQSAVSQRIGQLERDLGVLLIDRSVRPLELTHAGELFLDGGNDLIERYDRLFHRVKRLDEPVEGTQTRGRVKLAAIYSAGIDLLSQAVAAFEQQHPRVQVDISYHRPEDVHRRVTEGEADLGILSYPDRWRKVRVLPLRDEPMAVVCRPDHPLARRRKVEAAALTGLDMVAFELGLPVGRAIRRYLKEHGGSPKVLHSFDNVDTIKAAVLQVTHRFAILPARTVQREATAGDLSVIRLDPPLVRPMGLIHHGELDPGSAAEAFARFLTRPAASDARETERVR